MFYGSIEVSQGLEKSGDKTETVSAVLLDSISISIQFICFLASQYHHSPRRPAISEAILSGLPFLNKSCLCS